MKVKKEHICTVHGKKVSKIKFTNDNNYSLEFFNYGGYFHKILIPYKNHVDKYEDVILGYDKFKDYLTDQHYINALVGRVCGRIANAKFVLNGKEYILNKNDGDHHIHGGEKGFSKNIWEINNIEKDKDHLICELFYRSKDLEDGYPGNVDCIAKYSLNNKNEIIIDLSATTDKDTIINLTNHNYWNFHGHKNFYQKINDHFIKIDSDYVCEVDKDQIPSGELIDVSKTKYDLRKIKKIDKSILDQDGIDHCYTINKNKKLTEVSSIYSDYTKMGMIFFTDQPGLQLYTGNMMAKKYLGKYDKKYGLQHGICLEAQKYPDAINQPNFINPILKPGEKYSSKIIMRLKNNF